MGNKCGRLFQIIKESDDVIRFKKEYDKKIKKHSDIDPQEYTYKNHNLLHYSSKKGRINIVSYLCEKHFDIDKWMINEFTPLFCALKNKQNEVSMFLIDSGSDVNVITTYGLTSLMLAVSCSLECVIKVLSKYNLSNINLMTQSDGYSSLCYAAKYADSKICNLLIENGSDIFHINKEGDNILEIAKKNNNEEVVFYLIEYIASKQITFPSSLESSSLKFDIDKIEKTVSTNQIDKIGNFTVHNSDISRTPRTPHKKDSSNEIIDS